ncbi:MAG: hypothetical protein BRC23_02200 [Parcubacteria group bacterium SW_4_49_11]|nr:MAG: hypothetical protein BRC23_02200 [Parcubacteria group bacterium SW_4_49_11]
MKHKKPGFTLLEILLVVAAVGLLAAIVFVAINPSEQLGKVRDTERQSEVDTLHDAIRQYNIDNSEWPDEIASMSANSAKEICADGVSDEACINLTDDLTPEYIAEVPSGPNTEGTGSGYVVSKQNTRVRVAARNVEERSKGIAAGYSSNSLLDAHPFATLAYSIRLLRAGHVTETVQSGNTTAGSYLVRIRQDNANNDTADVLPDENGELSMDSTVQNTSNSADGQTLQTWVGGNNAYVTAWYDQSGNQDNGLSSTTGEQPQIIGGGSFITRSSIPQLQFDGTDDYLALEKFYDSADICSMTVSAWASMPDAGGEIGILTFDWSEYFRYEEGYHVQEDKLGFNTNGDTTHAMGSSTAIDDNTRQHVAAVFEESANPDKKVYVNGQSDGSADQHSGCLGKNTRYGSIGISSEMETFDGATPHDHDRYEGTIEQVV